MSFRWPSKDPDETLDYSVDWSRFLDTAIINSVIWFVKSNTYNVKTRLNAGQNLTNASSSAVTDTIQNVSQTNTNTVAEREKDCEVTKSLGFFVFLFLKK